MQFEAHDLNWLDEPFGKEELQKRIQLVRGSDFVITDIYHLAVSSWREGIPALCIGQGASKIRNTLSDKKKEVLYNQMFASDIYIFGETLEATLESEETLSGLLKSCAMRVQNKSHVDFVTETLERQKQKSLQKLINAIIPSGC